MTSLDVLESIKKHGATGVMVVALVWMNNRLNFVEDRLYDCYDRIATSEIRLPSQQHREIPVRRKNLVAVLPCNPIGKIKTC